MPQQFIYTMEDIEQRTHLSRHFLNRCNSKLSALLSPYRTYGENNRVLYDGNGFTLFDQIKQHKEGGKNLTQIREALEKHLKNRLQSDSETPQEGSQILQSNEGEGRGARSNADPASQAHVFIEEIRRMQKERQDEKDEKDEEVKHALRGQIKALEAQVTLLLPDGRTAEDVQQEREEAVRNKVEVTQLRSDKEVEQGRSQQRKTLLTEIEGLPWYARKRLREATAQLKQLEGKEPIL